MYTYTHIYIYICIYIYINAHVWPKISKHQAITETLLFPAAYRDPGIKSSARSDGASRADSNPWGSLRWQKRPANWLS